MFLVGKNFFSNRKGKVMKQLLLGNLKGFGLLLLASLLVVMCSDERQAPVSSGSEGSTEAVLSQSGSGSSSSASSSSTPQTLDESQVVTTSVSVSQESLALTSGDISWVVKVGCAYYKLPEYADSNVAYVVGSSGSESIKLYKGDSCSADLIELQIGGQSCAITNGSHSGDCGTIATSKTGEIRDSNDVVDPNDTISFSFDIVKAGSASDLSSEIEKKIEANIAKSSTVSVSGLLAPNFEANSKVYVDSNDVVKMDIGLKKISAEGTLDVRVCDQGTGGTAGNEDRRGFTNPSQFDLDSKGNMTCGEACHKVQGCNSEAACAWAHGEGKKSHATLSEGGFYCDDISLDPNGEQRDVVIKAENDDGLKSYQVIAVDTQSADLP